MEELKSQAAYADEAITTEKDFLRAPDLIKQTLDPLVLKIQLRITKGEGMIHARLDRVLSR